MNTSRAFIDGAFVDLPVTLGRLTLKRLLGRGGMAEVFLGDLHGAAGFARQVVAKRVRPDLRGRGRSDELFVREAQVLAAVRHDNIVDVVDFIEHAGEHWLLLEYVEGRSARQLLSERGALPIDAAIAVAAATARALAAVHDATDSAGAPLGLLHRDVSPDNVMIRADGAVKLLDFGISTGDALASLTTVGSLRGKVPYMAPEQLSGDVADARADLYSLGVTLYELACGARPFTQRTEALLMHAIVKEAPAAPSATLAAARPVDELCLWLLDKDPAARPQRAQQVASLLGGAERERRAVAAALAPAGAGAGADDDDDLEATVRRLRPKADTTRSGKKPSPSTSAPGWWSLVASLVDDDVVLVDEKSQTATPVARANDVTALGPRPPDVATATVVRAKPAATVVKSARTQSPPSASSTTTESPRPRRAWTRRLSGAVIGAAGGALVVVGLASLGDAPETPTTSDATQRPATTPSPATTLPPPTTTPTSEPSPPVPEPVPEPAPPEPATPEPPTTPTRRPEARQSGRLTVLAVPWAEVFVDGKRVGVTPVEGLKVDAGRRRVRLKGPGGEELREVLIASGKTSTIKVAMP